MLLSTLHNVGWLIRKILAPWVWVTSPISSEAWLKLVFVLARCRLTESSTTWIKKWCLSPVALCIHSFSLWHHRQCDWKFGLKCLKYGSPPTDIVPVLWRSASRGLPFCRTRTSPRAAGWMVLPTGLLWLSRRTPWRQRRMPAARTSPYTGPPCAGCGRTHCPPWDAARTTAAHWSSPETHHVMVTVQVVFVPATFLQGGHQRSSRWPPAIVTVLVQVSLGQSLFIF